MTEKDPRRARFCCSLLYDEDHEFGTVYLLLLILKDLFLSLVFVAMLICDFESPSWTRWIFFSFLLFQSFVNEPVSDC